MAPLLISARVRRTLLKVVAVLTFLVLAGATYQGVATALERRQFPHPGRLVDVGGHQLHIHCVGDGSPTVVLEAPATGMSAAWGWVQSRVGEETRVCSYDRAGLGWSEAGDGSYEPVAVAAQLHTLLGRAEEKGPYVLAGQDLGAALATLYAAEFGDELAALVLIDPPSPAATNDRRMQMTRLVRMSPWLARAGVLRASRLLSAHATGLPEPSAGALRAFLNRPDHLTRSARELARWDEAVGLAASASLKPGLRVVRVEAALDAEVPFLTDPGQAQIASAAITQAVAAARKKREPC